MVVDTSALVALILDEPEADRFRGLVADATSLKVSTVSVLEASLALEARISPDAGRELDLFLSATGFEIASFDEEQLRAARRAWRKYGKGNHPAGLNMGDCASYALSKVTGEPLLFKGNDFPQTDVESAL
jgi:ribonuclease VapC